MNSNPENHYSTVKKDATVTVIIASYLRHDTLNLALKSVYKQTYNKWRVLVIADCCDDNFKDKVDLSHGRVEFINLPIRCGNQYGPNSVGIHLADSEYIAFLNHDDMWLADHLEHALDTMRENQANFFMGRAAFCHPRNQLKNSKEKGRLVFSEINRPEAIWHCLRGHNTYFEPASSWVLKNKLSKNTGYWTPPDQLMVSPVMNWIQRAAKKKARFCFSRKLTTLKFNLHHSSDANLPQYKVTHLFIKLLKEYNALNPYVVRRYVSEDLVQAHSRGLLTRDILWKPILMTKKEERMQQEFFDFLTTNTDQNTETPSEKRTSRIRAVMTKRTGEVIERFVDPKVVIDAFLLTRKNSDPT